MRSRRPTRHLLAPILLALATSGCADSSPGDPLLRCPVSGTVTLDGAPLAAGRIQFNPTEGSDGVAASGEIKAGAFEIARAAGPVAGKYRVSISGRPAPTLDPSGSPGPLPRPVPETIPAAYNTRSTLTADVAPDGPPIAFTLKSR